MVPAPSWKIRVPPEGCDSVWDVTDTSVWKALRNAPVAPRQTTIATRLDAEDAPEDHLTWDDMSGLTLIHGVAGSGKTVCLERVMCAIAEGDAPLLCTGGEDTIAHALHLPGAVPECAVIECHNGRVPLPLNPLIVPEGVDVDLWARAAALCVSDVPDSPERAFATALCEIAVAFNRAHPHYPIGVDDLARLLNDADWRERAYEACVPGRRAWCERVLTGAPITVRERIAQACAACAADPPFAPARTARGIDADGLLPARTRALMVVGIDAPWAQHQRPLAVVVCGLLLSSRRRELVWCADEPPTWWLKEPVVREALGAHVAAGGRAVIATQARLRWAEAVTPHTRIHCAPAWGAMDPEAEVSSEGLRAGQALLWMCHPDINGVERVAIAAARLRLPGLRRTQILAEALRLGTARWGRPLASARPRPRPTHPDHDAEAALTHARRRTRA